MIRFLLATTLKDLRRRLADPLALVLWIGVPVSIGGLLALLGGGGDGTVPQAHILLVDEDNTFLSQLLAGMGEGGLGEFLDLETVTLEEGRAQIDDGKATALLIVPQGFQAAALAESPAELVLITNPAQRILPQIVEEGLEIMLQAAFYLQRLLGDVLQEMAQGPPDGQSFLTDETVATWSVELNQRLQDLESTLFPPVLTVETAAPESTAGPTSSLDFGRIFLPGILFMSILFIAQGASTDIWHEKGQGTLRRALSAPQNVAVFLGGKVLAGGVMVALIALSGLLVGVLFFDLAPARIPGALVWSSFAGTALLCYFLLLQLFSGSTHGGNLLSTVVVFPLIMLGGSFFPFEAMPDWMASIGRLTPNGLAVVRLKEILFGQPALLPLLTATAAIGLPAVLAYFLSTRRLRHGFAIG